MEGSEGGGIRITNREVYDGLLKVEKAVSRLEYRVDMVLGENVSLGKRVRSLELRYYGVLAGLIGTLASIGVAASGVIG